MTSACRSRLASRRARRGRVDACPAEAPPPPPTSEPLPGRYAAATRASRSSVATTLSGDSVERRTAPPCAVPTRSSPSQVHQHARDAAAAAMRPVDRQSLVVGRRKRRRGLDDLDRHIVAKQHRRGGRAVVRQRDERAARDRARPGAGNGGRSTAAAASPEIAMDDAQARAAMVEDAVAVGGARHHRGRPRPAGPVRRSASVDSRPPARRGASGCRSRGPRSSVR